MQKYTLGTVIGMKNLKLIGVVSEIRLTIDSKGVVVQYTLDSNGSRYTLNEVDCVELQVVIPPSVPVPSTLTHTEAELNGKGLE